MFNDHDESINNFLAIHRCVLQKKGIAKVFFQKDDPSIPSNNFIAFPLSRKKKKKKEQEVSPSKFSPPYFPAASHLRQQYLLKVANSDSWLASTRYARR